MPTYEPFEHRRRIRAVTSSMGFLPASEYLKLPRAVTSDERLASRAEDSWTPEMFMTAAFAFANEAHLKTLVVRAGDALPSRGPDVRFKYPEYENRVDDPVPEGQVIAVVMEGERVIGYGIAMVNSTPVEISVVDVDVRSRRDCGFQRKLTIGDEVFGVGVGHLVVGLLVSHLQARPLLVNAEVPSSAYICKSLGFGRHPDESNPRMLTLT